MDIFEACIRAVHEAHGTEPRAPERRGCAIVMHSSQHLELRRIRPHPTDPKLSIAAINHLPIWLYDGLVGPAVVDRRTLNLLMMVGARSAAGA